MSPRALHGLVEYGDYLISEREDRGHVRRHVLFTLDLRPTGMSSPSAPSFTGEGAVLISESHSALHLGVRLLEFSLNIAADTLRELLAVNAMYRVHSRLTATPTEALTSSHCVRRSLLHNRLRWERVGT